MPTTPAVRRRPTVVAVVDVGAYSVHLLVARVHGHEVERIADESSALGLGSVVDARGELGFEAGTRLVRTLTGYADEARQLGAVGIEFVATDPLRRAADAPAIVAEVAARTGVGIHVLSHEEEAHLGLLGVQAGRPVTRETVIVDVGGGSSELLFVGPRREPSVAGLALGAARLSRSVEHVEAPTRADIEALVRHARAVLATAPDAAPRDLVALGGTASNLLRVGPPLARRVLTVRRIELALQLLGGVPADVIAEQYGVKPSRARVLPGGAAILLAVAERYGRTQIRVSSNGLREGLAMAVAQAGPRWRDHLLWLATGWAR